MWIGGPDWKWHNQVSLQILVEVVVIYCIINWLFIGPKVTNRHCYRSYKRNFRFTGLDSLISRTQEPPTIIRVSIITNMQ